MEGGRGRVAGDVEVAQLQLVLRADARSRPPSRATSTPQRSSSRSVWSRLGSGSTTVVSPVGEQPGQQHAGLDLRGGDRQRVLDPAQRRARDRERRRSGPRARRSRAPIRAQRRRRSGRRAGGGSTRRRRASSSRPAGPASQPGSSRISVPALPTSIGAAGGRRARAARCRGWSARPPRALHQRAQRLHRVQRRVRVGGVEVARHPHGVGRSSRPAARRGGRATCRPARRACRAAGRRGRSAASSRDLRAQRAVRRAAAGAPRGRRGRAPAARPSRRRARRPLGLAPAGGVDGGEPLRARAAHRARACSSPIAARSTPSRATSSSSAPGGVAVGARGSPPTARRRRGPRASCRGTRCRPARRAGRRRRRAARAPARPGAARGSCAPPRRRAPARVQATSRPPSASTARPSASSGSSASPAGTRPTCAPASRPGDDAAQPEVSAPRHRVRGRRAARSRGTPPFTDAVSATTRPGAAASTCRTTSAVPPGGTATSTSSQPSRPVERVGHGEAVGGGGRAHVGVGVVARAAERAQQRAADQAEPDDAESSRLDLLAASARSRATASCGTVGRRRVRGAAPGPRGRSRGSASRPGSAAGRAPRRARGRRRRGPRTRSGSGTRRAARGWGATRSWSG